MTMLKLIESITDRKSKIWTLPYKTSVKGFNLSKLVGPLPTTLLNIWIHSRLDFNVLAHISRNIQKQPPEVFYKKGALRNFTKCTEKHLCQSLFFNKVAGKARIPIFSEPLKEEVAQNKDWYKRTLFLKHFNFFGTSTQRQDFQNSYFFHKATASKELHC